MADGKVILSNVIYTDCTLYLLKKGSKIKILLELIRK